MNILDIKIVYVKQECYIFDIFIKINMLSVSQASQITG